MYAEAQRCLTSNAPAKLLRPRTNQIVAHVSGSAVSTRLRRAGRGLLRNLFLGELRSPRHPFHLMTIPVARGKIHAGINSRRILLQNVFDHGNGLDEVAPANHLQSPQASDRE